MEVQAESSDSWQLMFWTAQVSDDVELPALVALLSRLMATLLVGVSAEGGERVLLEILVLGETVVT